MPPEVDTPSEGEVYDMYQSLLDDVTDEIFAAPDDVRHTLEPLHQALTTLLDEDDATTLQANEARFTALTPVMKTTNDALKKSLVGIKAVADKMNDAARVIGGITLLLNLATKFT